MKKLNKSLMVKDLLKYVPNSTRVVIRSHTIGLNFLEGRLINIVNKCGNNIIDLIIPVFHSKVYSNDYEEQEAGLMLYISEK